MNKSIFIIIIILSASILSAKEKYVSLVGYIKSAEKICICTVQEDNGDGTVSVRVDSVIKGIMADEEIIYGKTGHCIERGYVSRFMHPGKQYLVFLFKNNEVGRLGGIQEIVDDNIFPRFIWGFKGGTKDKYKRVISITLEEGLSEIIDALEEHRKESEKVDRHIEKIRKRRESEKVMVPLSDNFTRLLTVYLSDVDEVNADILYSVEKLTEYFELHKIQIVMTEDENKSGYLLKFGDKEGWINSAMTDVDLKEACEKLIKVEMKRISH